MVDQTRKKPMEKRAKGRPMLVKKGKSEKEKPPGGGSNRIR